ncbi:MAG: alpha/beta hydrolase [Bdellovibrionales bacterium]|nr:alpha/beta hydrolase [Bdellovibrionales bacterium]
MNWLILRGLARHQKHWGDFPKRLASQLKGRVECLDAPGFGLEANRPSPLSVKEIMYDYRSRWIQKHFEGDWGVLGHSLGGMVALEWAHRFPEDFKAVAVMNTSFKGLSPIWKRLSKDAVFYMSQILSAKNSAKKEELILKMITRKGSDHSETLKEWLELEKVQPSSVNNAIRQLFAASKYKAPEEIEVPLLVLSGGGDRMVDRSCSQKVADHFAAELRRHPTAGHDIALDDGRWLVDQISQFSASLKGMRP